MIAMLATVELLRFEPTSQRATAAFQALGREMAVTATTTYRGGSDLLVLWGPGHPARFVPMQRQVASGGHVVALDLSYWDRHRKVRVSFDAPHPQAWVLRKDMPTGRFLSDPISSTVTDAWDPHGPILVAGIGPKATTQYGDDVVASWERAQIRRCLDRWDRPIRYRFKKAPSSPPVHTTLAPSGPIDQVLRGSSLVITWHSNVAVDAIRLGIPVVCRDGAAAAVFPSDVTDVHKPLPTTLRDRFLANLAWFQWDPQTEASSCWAWIHEVLA